MTKKQHYMTEKERYKLESYLEAGKPVAWIAEQLGFCRKTIYNEIKRGAYHRIVERHGYYYDETHYSADKAQQIHEYNQTAKGRPIKLGNDRAYAEFLEDKMLSPSDPRKRLSPAAALAQARAAGFRTSVCVSTLYSYIYKNVFLHLTGNDLWEKPKRKVKKREDDEKRVAHKKLPSIEIRPLEINQRQEPGHWEMDLVISCKGSDTVLLTLTERYSRQEMIFKLPNRQAKTIRKVFDSLERKMPDFKQRFKSITTDNGPEFLEYDQLTRSIHGGQRFIVYYCHSYCAWEKGTNEVHNRMIRRWYPKGTDFSKVTKKQIAELQDWMNSYPRKILGWKAPKQVA